MSDPNTARTKIVLSPEQVRARKRRNVAIGITIGLLCLLFYAVTIAKIGPGILGKGM